MTDEPPPLTVREMLDRLFRQVDEQTPLAEHLRAAMNRSDDTGQSVPVSLEVDFDAQTFATFVYYSLTQISGLRQACYQVAAVVDAWVLNEIDPDGGALGID